MEEDDGDDDDDDVSNVRIPDLGEMRSGIDWLFTAEGECDCGD